MKLVLLVDNFHQVFPDRGEVEVGLGEDEAGVIELYLESYAVLHNHMSVWAFSSK